MASEEDQNQAKRPRLRRDGFSTIATDQKEDQQNQDYISLLPDDILLTIISKLQTRDAAVTTAISKRWAPLFNILPSLKITAATFNPTPSECYVENSYGIKWIDELYSLLRSRKTALKKFHIAVHILEPYADHFYDVFASICAAGVENLSITNTDVDCYYWIPSPVFDCSTIVKLEITKCWLEVPLKLTGLRSVKSLVLREVVVADDEFQRIISQCKAIEKLVIIDCLRIKNIVIHALRLSELVITFECPVRVVLKSAPRLVSVAILFDNSYDLWKDNGYDDEESDGEFSEGTNEAKNLMAFLNGLRGVKDLHLNFFNDYRMILSKDVMTLPTRLSPECYLVELKKLCICIPFNYNTFNMVISCLLNSSPNLMEIIICVKTNFYSYNKPKALELNFWEKQLAAECVKHHLTTATFYLDDYLSEDCFIFSKFLLRNAANLKNMNIFYDRNLKNIPNIAEKIKNELSAIHIASLDVEIMVEPIISRYNLRC
ncbi:putative F-box/FBD/LRR-repeat protein At4g00315 [Carex rostrata]